MNKKLFLVLLVFLLLSCNLPYSISVTSTPIHTSTLTPVPPPFPTPSGKLGMIVRGQVTLNGVGLAGVEIHQNFAAYPANLVAITDENGYYVTSFIGIPSDEMIGLEPRLNGYTFDPPYYSWRHYHGYETTTRDFAATPEQ